MTASFALVTAVLASGAVPTSFFEQFVDPKDGYFDTSQFLASRVGFLPVPIFITEPAIGYGGGAALVFLHSELGGRARKGASEDAESAATDPGGTEKLRADGFGAKKLGTERLGAEKLGTAQGTERKYRPPSISAAIGAATENGTWLTGAGHFGSWWRDQLRYLGFAGYANVNIRYYGNSNVDIPGGLQFGLQSFIFGQALKYRIPTTNLFLGLDYLLLVSEVDLNSVVPPALDEQVDLSRDATSSGLALVADYDSRDTIFTPSTGVSASLKARRFATWLGGDDDFWSVESKAFGYYQLAPPLVLGLRLDSQFVEGDAPFYMEPFLEMRGVPVLRYQGNITMIAETEVRLEVFHRFSLISFLGVGGAMDDLSEFGDTVPVYNYGWGARYFLARLFGLHMGVDVARGPEQWAFYIQVGGAWR